LDWREQHPTGHSWDTCPAEGCTAYFLDDAGGAGRSPVRKWWCSHHVHLSSDEDWDVLGAAFDVERCTAVSVVIGREDPR
jgi:hypothetical protein